MAFKSHFTKSGLKHIGKTSLITLGEVGVVTGVIILQKKFLDFQVLFKNKIATDPTFVKKWYMVHEGGIKFGVGVIAAAMIPKKYPWLKLIAIAVAVGGLIQEVRVWTMDSAGNSFFDKIGAGTYEDTAENDAIKRAAEQYSRAMNTSGPGNNNYTQSVASRYTQSVGGLDESVNMSVGTWPMPNVIPVFTNNRAAA